MGSILTTIPEDVLSMFVKAKYETIVIELVKET